MTNLPKVIVVKTEDSHLPPVIKVDNKVFKVRG